MRIQHNIAALNSYRNLGTNNSAVAKNLEKLSSGYRINRAGDDAAGLAISEKMRSQITGLNTATKNANDAISLVQTAEGALTEVHSMLNRMVEIATQSANGVYEDSVDRAALQDEMDALTKEIDRIADGTNFNKKNLLNGDIAATKIEATTKTAVPDATHTGTYAFTINVSDGKGGWKAATAEDLKGATITIAGKSYTVKDTDTDTQILAGIQGAVGTDKIGDVAFAGAAAKDKLAITGFAKGVLTVTAGAKADNAVDKLNAALNSLSVDVDGVDGGLQLQIGDTNDSYNHINVSVRDMHADKLGIGKNDINVKTEAAAGEAIDKINTAINRVSTQRGELGAIQNRLEHTINNLSVNAENMTAAESRIRDVDMADEMMKYTKNNILVQASQAMLAQANQVPQGVLQLLQ